jgi:hypothetical protein
MLRPEQQVTSLEQERGDSIDPLQMVHGEHANGAPRCWQWEAISTARFTWIS